MFRDKGQQKQWEMGEMSICLCFPYCSLAYYVRALVFCARANWSIIHAPEWTKCWWLPKRKHRLGHDGCTPDNTGEAQAEISQEKWLACCEALYCHWGIKKMDWEEQGGLWNGFPGGPCRVQGSAWEEGLCTGSRWPVTQRGKGWELSVGNLCRVKSRGLGKCWLLQSAEWIWAKMQKKRRFVGCVTHLWRFLIVYDFGGASPDTLVVCAVPGSEAEGKRQRLSGSRLCVTLWRWMRCTPAGIPAPLTAVRADSQRTATEGGKILDVGSCPFGFCAEYWGQH